ncbi:MAG: hypothetical protein KGL74_07165 [Elusimicrobia bacterium]|nr:hypothetical protein [Elusimicrobiota bacterium]
MRFALLAVLLSAAPARASESQSGASGFAVANGPAAYAVVTDGGAVAGRVILRRLGLDGGVLWEDRFGSGRNESPVAAAVTSYGGVSVVGDDDTGCFAGHWSQRSTRVWSQEYQYGSECRARTVLVDGSGNTYLLATTVSGGASDATLWKIDRRGETNWVYHPSRPTSHYAFALTLSAAGDVITVTTAANGPAGWVYDSFDVDSSGRTR